MGLRRPVAFAFAAVVSCLVAVGCLAETKTRVTGSGSELGRRLDAALAAPALRGARVGALVVRASDGAVLYERSPDRMMVPASNVKILTAMAALSTFGPAYQFETGVFASGPPDATGTVRFLAVRGAGDPALNSEDWWLLVSELRRQGIRRIEGDLILDDLAFDAKRWNETWGQVSVRAYHAPVGALTANYGAFSVTVAPAAKIGEPARVAIDPPVPYLLLDNRARTGPPSARRKLVVDRRSGPAGEKVVVTGVVRASDKPEVFYRSVVNPTLYAGAVLRMQLEAVGIEFSGQTRLGSIPADAVELVAFKGRPLREIVRLFVKYSNNAVAETLVKAMGARGDSGVGTWESGVRAMRAQLLALGLEPQDFDLVDGSGLSYQDKVSPRGLVRALRIAYESFEFGPELISALPIAAVDGTLKKRTREAQGEVRAKTGLLNGVTSLSGFARPPSAASAPTQEARRSDALVFSILVNGYKVSDERAMDAVDRFAAELVRSRSGG